MSKGALLRAMKERGHSWYPATVTRVETGAQSARSAELEDLKTILKTSLDRLFWPEQEAQATEFLYAAGAGVVRAHEDTAEAAAALLRAIRFAETWCARYKDTESSRVAEARDDTASRAQKYDLDSAISEGVSRFEHGGRESSE